MTSPNTDGPVVTAASFVAAAAVLAAIMCVLLPSDWVGVAMEASAAAEAGLDPASIGYKSQPNVTTLTRADLHR